MVGRGTELWQGVGRKSKSDEDGEDGEAVEEEGTVKDLRFRTEGEAEAYARLVRNGIRN